ncbi:MAG: DUF6370 family protein [Planctomycetota bacterium]|jgi:hypothetical protein
MRCPLTRFTLLLTLVILAAGCQPEKAAPEPSLGAMTVEASCGQCQFDLPGGGCDLAVRFDGKAYYVDGTGIDDHGDAHAADGFCNAVRQARVTGRVVDGRFEARSFALVP